MASLVALILSVGLIVGLLALDVRRRTSLGLAIWLPTLFLMTIASRPLSLWLGLGGPLLTEDSLSEGSAVDRWFYLLVIVSSLAVASQRGVPWQAVCGTNRGLLLFYLYFGLSTLWAVEPIGSFKRWFKDLGMVFVSAVVLSEKSPGDAIRAVFVRSAIVLIPLSVLLIRYYPALGRFYSRSGELMVTGVTTQKNSLGETVMLFVLFTLWDYLEVKQERPWLGRGYSVILLLGIWLLVASDSQTALLCLAAGVLIVLFRRVTTLPAASGMVVVACLASPVFVLATTQFASALAPLLQMLGRDVTFTGRSDIWRFVLNDAPVNPWIGAGFFNFWGSDAGTRLREVMDAPGVYSAHNGYLDIYLDGGYVGVAIVIALLIGLWRRVGSEGRTCTLAKAVRLACLVILVLYNLSESAFGRIVPTWFSGVLMYLWSESSPFRTSTQKATGAAWTAKRHRPVRLDPGRKREPAG